jgi:hypothetical protein
MAQIILTGSGTWNLPADWNDAANTIEIYAAGGNGATGTASASGGGGGGGGYIKATNVPLKASNTAGYVTSFGYGANGSYLWQGTQSYDGCGFPVIGPLVYATTGNNASGITAGSGGVGGGASINAVSYLTLQQNGGSGGGGRTNATAAGGGGGGAAGPNGNGGAGSTNTVTLVGNGGGGGNGGGAGSGATGGTAGTGAGAGGAGGIAATSGTAGGAGTSVYSGGGGGGSGDGAGTTVGGAGGSYGGGGGGGASSTISTGGLGAGGIIVITYTPVAPVTYYWVGGTGTWSGTGNTQFALTSGGTATSSNPTAIDTVIFDANSGTSATVTVASTAVSLSTTINKSDITLLLSGSPTLCTEAGTLTLTAGTLNLNNNALSIGLFNSSNSNARTVTSGTGTFTLTGSATTIWQTGVSTNLTYTTIPTVNATYSGATGTRAFSTAGAPDRINLNITAGTDVISPVSTFIVNNYNFTGFSGTLTNISTQIYGSLTLSTGMTVSAGANTFTFRSTSSGNTITSNGKTMDFPVTFNGVGGTWACQDALTLGSTRALTFTNGTLQLAAGTTSTVGSFVTSGTTLKYLQSTTSGTQATISDASGTNTVTYLNIKDSNATGGATWDALATSNVNAGNNAGWSFSSVLKRYIYTRRKNKVVLT